MRAKRLRRSRAHIPPRRSAASRIADRQLAAAHLARAREYALGAQRQGLPQSLLEDLLHAAWKSQMIIAAERAPAAAAASRMGPMSSSLRPGMMGATLTETGMPAAARRDTVFMRRAGVATYGSMARACASFQKGMLTVTLTSHVRDERRQELDVALDERRLGDDVHRIAILGAHLEARARQPVRGFERLVAVGDAAEDE